MHSRYSRVVKDLPCVGQQVQLISPCPQVLLRYRALRAKDLCRTASPARRPLGTDDDSTAPGHARHRVSYLRQIRSTVGLALGDEGVVDDDCSPRHGSADQTSNAGAVSGH